MDDREFDLRLYEVLLDAVREQVARGAADSNLS